MASAEEVAKLTTRQEQAAVEYKLGPGDVISIGVYNIPDLNRTTRVSNSGKIHYPSLGVMKVAGVSPHDLQVEIARRLQESGQVKDPTVQVTVLEQRAQPVYILGEIQFPGQFVINGQMRMLDLITLAGGFTDGTSNKAYLYRRKLKDPDVSPIDAPDKMWEDEATLVDFKALLSGSHPDLNIELRGGDILYVPLAPRNRYFVVGEVLKTGVFDLDAGQQLLASEALARAGGPARTAKLSKGIVVRYDDNGERKEVPIDFDAILHGKKPDFDIKPEDVIFIPGSSIKTLGFGLLNTLPGLAGRAMVIP